MSAFYISAAHKSSGKTIVSIGLARALSKAGQQVQTFKKGPDYIDPNWLQQAASSPCYTLDFFTASTAQIKLDFHQKGANKEIVLVEGNKGLYDGISADGSDSNAAMAQLLDLPVILVIDCAGITRGIAPLICGYQSFDPTIHIAGIILNKVGGKRHLSKLIQALETYCDIPVIGAIQRNPELEICERHLGLKPQNEMSGQACEFIEHAAQIIEESVDIEKLLELTFAVPASLTGSITSAKEHKSDKHPHYKLRIAIAMDEAFSFYYPSDLERFKELGTELVPFNTLHDTALPDAIDGLIIGGGFPETNLKALSTNTSLMIDIKENIESELPTYAECGGLMYLARSIRYNNETMPMANVIAADCEMHDKPKGRGYVELSTGNNHPWMQSTSINAHEFHYSSLNNIDESLNFAYSIQRGSGITGQQDGIVYKNCLASYSHLRQTDNCHWVDDFLAFVHKQQLNRIPEPNTAGMH